MKPVKPAPIREIPDDFEFAGYPVESVPMASARGLWPLHWISVSGSFLMLDADTQIAVLWHEAAHCIHKHREKRLLLLPFWWTAMFRTFCHRQEMEADRLVVDRGHGRAFLHFLKQVRAHLQHAEAKSRHHDDDHWHPELGERIAALEAYMKGAT